MMACSRSCFGHEVRAARRNKISKVMESVPRELDRNKIVLIKKGPSSMETSLEGLEEIYAKRPEWKSIEDGGVLSVPIEEFRMINPPKPDRFGNIDFGKKRGRGAGNLIESYPITETVANLNEKILIEYDKEKKRLIAEPKSEVASEQASRAMALKLPEFTAVQKWLDNEAEIDLKKTLGEMMTKLEIPALIIRSVNLKAISALKDLGLELQGDAEIDLVLAFVSGDLLHVVIFEVKRADTYLWQAECSLPNKQAINKAENQLSKDVDVMMTILVGITPSQIKFQTLVCFPESSSLELQNIFCASCLGCGIVFKEDLADLSLLQKKTNVPDKPDLGTTSGKKTLLTLTARLLSQQSLLHIGYREVEDKEKLVSQVQY